MGKNNSDNLHSIKNAGERFHVTVDVGDIWTVDIGTIGWFLECLKSAGKVLLGNSYLWSMMKKLSVSRMQRFVYSQTLCHVLERWIRTQHPMLFGNSWIGSKIHHNTELWTQLTESRWNSSGIFPGFTALQLVQEVQKFLDELGEPSQFKGRIIFMSMFNDIIWRSEDNERECNANATLVSTFAKRFSAGRWSFLGPGSEIKWYSTYKESPGGEWDKVA